MSGRALLSTGRDPPSRGALWWTPRREPGRLHKARRHLRAIQSGVFEREQTNFSSHRRAGRSLPVLPVVAARRDDRERHQTLIVNVSPGQRDERRHGQTHFALGAELGRDGMTAGLCFRSRHDETLQRRGIARMLTGGLTGRCRFTNRTLQRSSAGTPLDF